ncbi:MAG: hypothetical protein ACE5LA_02320 [Dehalococcoidales bacterium]
MENGFYPLIPLPTILEIPITLTVGAICGIVVMLQVTEAVVIDHQGATE